MSLLQLVNRICLEKNFHELIGKKLYEIDSSVIFILTTKYQIMLIKAFSTLALYLKIIVSFSGIVIVSSLFKMFTP